MEELLETPQDVECCHVRPVEIASISHAIHRGVRVLCRVADVVQLFVSSECGSVFVQRSAEEESEDVGCVCGQARQGPARV